MAITGSGSTLFAGSSVYVGIIGAGSLTIGGPGNAAGACMETGGPLYFASAEGSIGSARIIGPGSSWVATSAQYLTVGDRGLGTLSVEDGALFDTTGNPFIAIYPSAAGSRVDIIGAGSRWIERAGQIYIASGGAIRVGAGAALQAPGILIDPGGTLSGEGQITALITNRGTIKATPAPGAPSATLVITGNYDQTNPGVGNKAGSLHLTIGGTAEAPWLVRWKSRVRRLCAAA